MTTASINTDMLTWARERSGISVPDFARRCGISEERLREWESGERKLTFNQAMRFAEKAHVPFGYLFLAKPPEEVLPIPDLRTLEGQGVQRPSAELLDLVKLMMQRQEWYREYLQQHFAQANPYVGRASYSDSVESIVEDIRACLGVEPHPTRGKWDDYYRDLVQRIESLGILVMRQGNLGHHSRPLNVEEFRGFAIVDEYAPIIFVNHSDALGARLFTLIHELCHIWIGQSGISDGDTNTHRQEEVLCNAVAAEFLVPAQEFRALWQHDSESWEDNLPPLEAHFHVSTWALARRALTLNFISQQEYGRYIFEQKKRYEQRKGSGGPTYYQTKKAQISRQFSQAVVGEALSGQLLLREAGELLGGIKPGKIETFARELGV
ncbi:helix-turn-helix domain-containing protein [Marinobacter nauticus]|uniref:Helix-turn-helix protein n=1 Tax=Marinobacter nauticus TaxID=2743 RepID=A0A368V7Z4_MARNT|nr:XRE family transcriptional regulator [Marinobacter nauticus]RBP75621.1 helix-turn-helix protein [Marinobacter nauticus]RCW36430.1 helix-turn-helix protein [Marinobacter nauticus]